MDFSPEGPKAIPLWINGHAFLTVTESFYDVVSPLTGEAVRRVPLCGADEARAAVAAAVGAQAAWSALAEGERQRLLDALAEALDRYTGHFAKLVREETGCSEEAARDEVGDAVAALRAPSLAEGGLVGLVVDATRPLAGFAAAAAPALRGGATLVVKPSPKAPSAVFALCELSSRAAWPDGVLNLLQGDAPAIEGLCQAGVARLAFAGEAALSPQVEAIAVRCGTPFVAVAA